MVGSWRRALLLLCLQTVLAQIIEYVPYRPFTGSSHLKTKLDTQTLDKIDKLGKIFKTQVRRLREEKSDIVFLLDSSASVGVKNFYVQVNFIRKFLSDFTVSFNETRVAVVTFSSKEKVHVQVDHISESRSDNHKCSLLEEQLPNVEFSGGGTFTLGAFLQAEHVLKSTRAESHKVIFLITDGFSNGGNPLPVAQRLKERGVEIYTLGIANGDPVELKKIASEPNSDHSFILASFKEFETLVKRSLHEDLRPGKFELVAKERCDRLCSKRRDCCDRHATCRCGTRIGYYACACLPGYFGTGQEGECEACPANTYRSDSSNEHCSPCPDPNQSSPPASTSVSQCTCRQGYKVDAQLRCISISCEVLEPPQFGYLMDKKCDTALNAACAIRCLPGYTLVGSSIRSCQNDSTWSGEHPTCQPKRCRPLPIPKHGLLRCNNKLLTFGSKCRIVCKEAYSIVGSATRTCMALGVWDGLPAKCRPARCDPLDRVEHAEIEPASCTERSKYGQTCRYVCHRGYTITGAENSTCTADGSWTSTAKDTKCQDVQPPILRCPDNITKAADPGRNGTEVTWAVPEAEDNSGASLSMRVVPAILSPKRVSIGRTRIWYIAQDGSNNRASCSFDIVIVDGEPPGMDNCHSPDPVITDAQSAPVSWTKPVFIDNGGPPVEVHSTHQPGPFPRGHTLVRYIALDSSNNHQVCELDVQVRGSSCPPVEAPSNGELLCRTSVIEQCRLVCRGGYGIADTGMTDISCNNGAWRPENALSHLACSPKIKPDESELNIVVTVTSQLLCENKLWNEVVKTLIQSINVKAAEASGSRVGCNAGLVKKHCDRINERNEIPRRVKRSYRDYETSYLESDDYYVDEADEAIYHKEPTTPAPIKAPKSAPRINDDRRVFVRNFGGTALFSRNDITRRNDLDNAEEEEEEEPGHTEMKLYVTLRGSPKPNSGRVTSRYMWLVMGRVARALKYAATVKQLDMESAGSTFIIEQFEFDLSKSLHCRKGSVHRYRACVLCPVGTYHDTTNDHCRDCPLNTFTSDDGKTECTRCPEGSITRSTRSTSSDNCTVPCPPGSYSATGVEPCTLCGVGSFQESEGQRYCVPCIRNRLTPSEGSTSKEQCLDTEIRAMDTDREQMPCTFDTCLNGGHCVTKDDDVVCECPDGYEGVSCEVEVSRCRARPCRNNATCMDDQDTFMCLCQDGFSGRLCEVNDDDCKAGICGEHGTCIDGVAGYSCRCHAGWTGSTCDVTEDPCHSKTCYNHAACTSDGTSAFCICAPGFRGEKCQQKIDQCASQPCKNYGICKEEGLSFRCECSAGFTGPDCAENVDDCASKPCQHGECTDQINGYICRCLPGYTGINCHNEQPKDYLISFTDSMRASQARLSFPDTLKEFTLSLWMRSRDTQNQGTPVSYANQHSDNALTLTDYNGLVLSVNGEEAVTEVSVTDDVWHHVVATWSRDGQWRLYLDGELEESGSELSSGQVIQGGGVLILGQEQDSIGGSFNPGEAFLGQLTRVNLWRRAMTETEIKELIWECSERGDVVAWGDFYTSTRGARRASSLFCQACREPVHPQNGQAHFSSTAVRSNVSYQCESGYSLVGQKVRHCLVTGQWSAQEPRCQVIRCPHPGRLTNGRVLGRDWEVGSSVKYQCNIGYWLLGEENRDCSQDGQWTGNKPICREIRCSLPPHLNEESTIRDKRPYYRYLETVHIKCKIGYRLVGKANLTCTLTNEWDNVFPTCVPDLCTETPIIANGRAIWTRSKTFTRREIEYECNVGYHFKDVSVAQCVNDTWTVPSCVLIQCPEPEDIGFGERVYENVSVGSEVQYRCDVGYEMIGSSRVRCLGSGAWSGGAPECVIKTCRRLNAPHNGWVRYSSRNYNATAYFECRKHYSLTGETVVRCTETGRWSDREPHCVRAHCEPLTLPEFAIISTNETTIGSHIKVSCHAGHFLVGDKELLCMPNGRWSGKIPSCRRVQCPEPRQISHGEVSSTGNFYNDTVMFTCEAGYTLDGTAKSTCELDSTWSHDPPTCKQTACIPKPIPYGNFTYNQTHITYSCHDNYTMIGVNTMVCRQDYHWEYRAPQCVKTDCRSPIIIEHGYVEVHTIMPLVIAYSCQPGYRTIGQPEMQCSNGNWSQKPPECVQGCPEPPHVENGRPLVHKNQYEVGAKLQYTCNDGYRIKVLDEIICVVEKGIVFYWKGRPPMCNIIQCSIPTERILRGRLIRGKKEKYISGDKVEYQCVNGYRFSGSGDRTCENGTWTPIPDCVRVRCPDPEPLRNGSIHGDNYFYRGRIFYSCDRGFKLHGSQTRLCKEDGSWSAGSPQCRHVECPIPDPVPHGNWSIDLEKSSDAQYACKEGYILFGHAVRRCGDDGKWRGDAPSCHAVNCTMPPPLNNAKVSYLGTSLHSQAIYECNKGFLIQGHSAITCLSNGTWTTVSAHCERITCSQPVDLPNGQVYYTSIKFKSMVMYTCNRGYRLVGSRDAYCTWRGHWSESQPSCQPILCPAPPELAHSLNNATEPYYVGRVVSYHCQPGYWTDAPRRIRCLETGEWTKSTLNCKRVKCPIVRAPHDGSIQGTGRSIGTEIRVHCNAGYTANNAETKLICLESGQWSSNVPVCSLVKCPGLPVLKHGNIYSSTEDWTFGTVVRVVCHEGYELGGKQEIQCLANQTWSAELATCSRIGCITPKLANGWLNNDFFYYRDTVHFHCDPGYELVGASSLVCNSDHNWNGDTPVCKPVNCPEPDYVKNAVRRGDNFKVGEVVQFTCDPGHWLSGSGSIKCGWQGKWNDTVPTCRKVTCPMPDSIENGAVSAQSLNFGDTVTYYCNVGFKLIGKSKLNCLENSTWSSSTPKCIRIVCRPPEVIEHARQLGVVKRFYLPGQRVGYQCEDTYRSSSSNTEPIEQTCGLDGRWTAPTGICTMISCPSRPSPVGGRIVIQTPVYGGMIIYRCNYGYKMSGSRHRLCLKDGKWSGIEPRCEQIVCPEPAKIPNGDIVGDKYLADKRIEYRCNIGHKLIGRSTIRCNSTGHWMGEVPKCEIVKCQPPANIEHGMYVGSTFEYGSTVQYKCEMGYRLSGDISHRCLLNGTWAGRVPVCVQMYCPVVTDLEHGSAKSTGNVYGAMTEYACDVGYRLQGPSARFCSENGQWTGYKPECERVECFELPTVENGQVQAVSGTTYYYNDTVDVTCSPGHLYQSQLTPLYCNKEGQWSGSLDRCKPVSCGQPASIDNGIIEGDTFTFRERITYRCRPGHRLSGPWSRHCNSFGEWDGEAPRCIPVKCKSLKPIKHGSLSTLATVYKTLVLYKCDAGYALIGRKSRSCRKDGSWSAHPPYCRKVNCPRPDHIENGHFSARGYKFGNTIKYSCDSGYKLIGPNFRKCKSDGRWSEESPKCQWASCDPPSGFVNGTIVGDTYYYGSTLQFYCNRGYHLEGTRTIECVDEKVWSHEFPTCVRKFCGKPKNILNGFRYGNSNEPGSKVKYRCLPGHRLKGMPTIVCHPNGKWSGRPPKCLNSSNAIDAG